MASNLKQTARTKGELIVCSAMETVPGVYQMFCVCSAMVLSTFFLSKLNYIGYVYLPDLLLGVLRRVIPLRSGLQCGPSEEQTSGPGFCPCGRPTRRTSVR